MKPERIILDWGGSPVERSIDWLLGESEGGACIDLSHLWVITQTNGAAQRLREGLAQASQTQGSACLLPRFSAPGSLIKPDADSIDGIPIASQVQVLAFWTQVVKDCDLTRFPHLFPQIPQSLDLAWGMSMAQALVGLRETLAEADHDCQSVEHTRLTEKWGEQDRWTDLSNLEKHYRQKLEKEGFLDPMDARRKWSLATLVPRGVDEVVLLGVSGFPDLGRKALENLMSQGLRVRVIIFASPEENLSSFDPFGRPVRSAWESKPMTLTDDRIRLVYGPREQARTLLEYGESLPFSTSEFLSVGVLDSEVKERLAEEAEQTSRLPGFHDPEGKPGKESSLYAWLKAIQDLLVTEGMKEAVRLLRFPQTLHCLQEEGITGEVRDWLIELDQLHQHHLPQTWEDGFYFVKRRKRTVAQAWERIGEWMRLLREGSFEDEIRKMIRSAFTGRPLDPECKHDQDCLQLLPKFSELLEEISKVKELSFEERFSLLLEQLAQECWVEEAAEGELKLHGWLELAWADAPRMIVLGCNDVHLPESLPADSFIPQSLRRELGLWTDEDRTSRDAYLLHWLVESKKQKGRIDFILGKFSRDGSPLRPSPLFFLCHPDDPETLPNRAEKLFGEVPPEDENPAWAYPWKLEPGEREPIHRLSVTAFRDFLSCPFRFYLKRKFGMQTYDAEKAEADAMDFGTLVHGALEALYGLDTGDESEIFMALKKQVEEDFSEKYGRNPSLSLLQQKAAIERRMRCVAQLRALEISDGWQIQEVEKKFHLEARPSSDGFSWLVPLSDKEPLSSEGSVRIVGKIDRIDYHPQRGVYRLLDYKTSAKSPEDLHFRGGYARIEEFPEFCRFEWNGRPKRWLDLQLPLYRAWAERTLLRESGQSLEVGLFTVPAQPEEIGIQVWDGLQDELMESSMECARGIVRDLLEPAEHQPISKLEYDDFEDLFFHSPEEAIVGFV